MSAAGTHSQGLGLVGWGKTGSLVEAVAGTRQAEGGSQLEAGTQPGPGTLAGMGTRLQEGSFVVGAAVGSHHQAEPAGRHSHSLGQVLQGSQRAPGILAEVRSLLPETGRLGTGLGRQGDTLELTCPPK